MSMRNVGWKNVLHYNFSSRDSLSLILKTNHISLLQPLTSGLTSFTTTRMIPTFWCRISPPTWILTTRPTDHWEAAASTSWRFSQDDWCSPCSLARVLSGLGVDFPSQWRLQHGRWHNELPGMPEESCLWDLEVNQDNYMTSWSCINDQ